MSSLEDEAGGAVGMPLNDNSGPCVDPPASA